MRPIAEFPTAAARSLRFLLTDIDDTVTEEGRLPAASLAAMEALSEADLKIIPVTGRPAGWCDHIARMWPVDAVVGENGALWFAYDRKQKRMASGFAKERVERQADRRRLDALREEILEAVPGAGVASDQDYRIADLAIDFCEDVPPLSAAEIEQILRAFRAAGATAKVSSIHVNGWFGDYDKLSMTRRCLAEVFDCDLDAAQEHCLFAGDSPNDQPMFGFFAHSVGMANVCDFQLSLPPRWVTQGRSAQGFVELCRHLLEQR